MQPMQLGGNVLSMPSFTTDNHKYDMLFEQEVFVRKWQIASTLTKF